MVDEGVIESGLGSREEERAAHERFIDRSLLGLYDDHRHELSVSQEVHELVEQEEESPDAAIIVRNILIELEAAVEGRYMMQEDKQWLRNEVNALHVKLDTGELGQEDVQNAVLLVRDLLFRLYPKKTIDEIKKELDIRTLEDSLKEEQQEAHYSPEEREARIQGAARELYSARYDWGYYPELADILGLSGEKIEDEKKIRAKEAEFKPILDHFVDREKAAGRTDAKSRYFPMIAEKIKQGIATSDEELQYKLENNKLRMQWFSKFLPAFEDLAVYGEDDTFVAFWNDAWKLAKHAEWKREIVTDEDRREREEQLKALGRNPGEAVSKIGVGKEEVDAGNQLIDDALMTLYPEAIELDGNGRRTINRTILEEILGVKKK